MSASSWGVTEEEVAGVVDGRDKIPPFAARPESTYRPGKGTVVATTHTNADR